MGSPIGSAFSDTGCSGMPTDPARGAMTDALSPAVRHPIRYPSTLLDWARGFTLHILTGFLAVAVHYTLMGLLLRLGTSALFASGAGFLAGAVTRYLMSHYKVFAPTGSVQATIIKFVAALGAQMAANLALLELLMRLDVNVWISQVCATVVLTFINYLAYRLWVFK